MRRLVLGVAVALPLGWSGAAGAQEKLDGYFIALTECEANKKKASDNPGNVRLEIMRAYEMLGRNATPGTHYLVKVPGAPVTDRRWVSMQCGDFAPEEHIIAAGVQPPPPNGDDGDNGGNASLPPDSIELVLAASWQPGFCATSNGRNKIECQTQTPDRPDATQFSIHGLWPDDLDDKDIFPCYCDRGDPVRCRGSRAPDGSIDLSDDILADLRVAMPGVQSGLHLHEWTKHGTCYEDDKSNADADADPDEYYRETMALMDALNASPVKDLFVDHLGEVLTREQIETAFDEAFGAGAGERVIVRCSGSGNSVVITELWIGLKGDAGASPDLASLILAAPTTAVSSTQQSCTSGRVVEVE